MNPATNHAEEEGAEKKPGSPKIADGLLRDIQHGVPLKHVDAAAGDRSAPAIEPDAHVRPSQRAELLTEVRAAAAHVAVVREVAAVGAAAGAGDCDEDLAQSPLAGNLRHVEPPPTGDAPHIAPDAHVGTWDKPGLLNEIAVGASLRHVAPEELADRSAPAIEPGVHVGEAPAKAVLAKIASGEVPALRHVTPPR